MAADVITIAVASMTFCRAAVSTEGMYRFNGHLSIVALHILLQMVAQKALLSACYAS